MKHDEEIEMLLWNFIDGNCNEAEHRRIADLITGDTEWKRKFEELSALHQNIHPELEQPSMRFTKNVMEAVAKTQVAPATKKYINPYIVRGIAVLFIIPILAVLVYALFTTNWNTVTSVSLIGFDTSKLHLHNLFNSNVVYTFILINIMLGLLFMDGILRRKRLS